ncbi:MAG: hypothetical protein MUO54_12365 [Anaerolineales bacterium]|nr:hypothetical protein [Anaerolineales bacterium]
MKSMKITDRDWIQLSAYLDGELRGKELEQLRKRLQSNPRLQAALDELIITKQVLKAAPLVPASRRFTLTAEMVDQKVIKTANTGYRVAAALMSFLLIGVLILDFGGIFFSGAMSAVSSPKSYEVQLESMPELAADAIEEPALMDAAAEAETWTEEALEVAEFEEEITTEDISAGDAPAVALEAAEVPLAEGMVGDELEEKTQDTDIIAGANRAQDGENELQNTPHALPSQTAVPAPGVIEYYPEEEVYDQYSTPQFSILRILEIIFGLGIAGFTAAAWAKRRKSR